MYNAMLGRGVDLRNCVADKVFILRAISLSSRVGIN